MTATLLLIFNILHHLYIKWVSAYLRFKLVSYKYSLYADETSEFRYFNFLSFCYLFNDCVFLIFMFFIGKSLSPSFSSDSHMLGTTENLPSTSIHETSSLTVDATTTSSNESPPTVPVITTTLASSSDNTTLTTCTLQRPCPCHRNTRRIVKIYTGKFYAEVYFDSRTFIQNVGLPEFRRLLIDYLPSEQLTVMSSHPFGARYHLGVEQLPAFLRHCKKVHLLGEFDRNTVLTFYRAVAVPNVSITMDVTYSTRLPITDDTDEE